MKKLIIFTLTASILPSVFGATQYNQTITAIYGTGNTDTGWTLSAGPNGMDLALRGVGEGTGITPNTAGNYTFPTGYAAAPFSSDATWDIAFSVNSGLAPLAPPDYYWLTATTLGGVTTTFNVIFGPTDDAFGTVATPNGGGTVGSALATPALLANTIAQNAENIVFFGLDPNTAGVYTFDLFATTAATGNTPSTFAPAGAVVNSVGITVDVVPDAANTVLLLSFGMLSLAGFEIARRKLQAN